MIIVHDLGLIRPINAKHLRPLPRRPCQAVRIKDPDIEGAVHVVVHRLITQQKQPQVVPTHHIPDITHLMLAISAVFLRRTGRKKFKAPILG
jgi:hypothetical protein